MGHDLVSSINMCRRLLKNWFVPILKSHWIFVQVTWGCIWYFFSLAELSRRDFILSYFFSNLPFNVKALLCSYLFALLPCLTPGHKTTTYLFLLFSHMVYKYQCDCPGWFTQCGKYNNNALMEAVCWKSHLHCITKSIFHKVYQ
jgi:hypothetical protein